MGERRKARRYEVYLPLQVCMSRKRPAEFYTAQLREFLGPVSTFHSTVPIEPGTGMELTFALPPKRDKGTSVLVRASAKAAACVDDRRGSERRSESDIWRRGDD